MNWLRGRIKAIRLFFADLVVPFATIARELRRANDLKTLELSERINPFNGEREPIIPITEQPGKSDTEVFFGAEPDAHGRAAMRKKLANLWENEGDDE